jgi:cell division initiation protein
VADEFERLFQENAELNERIQNLDEQVASHAQLKNALEKTLVSAQLQADQMMANARKESELTLKDAEMKARQLVTDSYAEIQRVQQNLAQLKSLEEDFRFKFQTLLDGYAKLLGEGMVGAQIPMAEVPVFVEPVIPAPSMTVPYSPVALEPESLPAEYSAVPAASPEKVPPVSASLSPSVAVASPVASPTWPHAPLRPETDKRRSDVVPHVDETKPIITAPGGSLRSLVAEASGGPRTNFTHYDPIPEPDLIYGEPVRIEPVEPLKEEPVQPYELVGMGEAPTREASPAPPAEPDLGHADDRTLEQAPSAGQQFFLGNQDEADDFFGEEVPLTEKSREFEW